MPQDSAQLKALNVLKAEGENDDSAAIWRLTLFIDAVGENYQFEWEREWRHAGDLRFDPSAVAFLLFDEANHSAARKFFRDAELNNEGPDYPCLFIDAQWASPRRNVQAP